MFFISKYFSQMTVLSKLYQECKWKFKKKVLICCFSPKAADSLSLMHLPEAYPLKWRDWPGALFISLWLVFPVSRPGFWKLQPWWWDQISPPLWGMNRSALVLIRPAVLQTCRMVRRETRKWMNEEVVLYWWRVQLIKLQCYLLLRALICKMGIAGLLRGLNEIMLVKHLTQHIVGH